MKGFIDAIAIWRQVTVNLVRDQVDRTLSSVIVDIVVIVVIVVLFFDVVIFVIFVLPGSLLVRKYSVRNLGNGARRVYALGFCEVNKSLLAHPFQRTKGIAPFLLSSGSWLRLMGGCARRLRGGRHRSGQRLTLSLH
ncbi:hypothetical protein K491DRAFT_313444 [Lophiostoma macrostomum CBS 122681]|uniref:Uncharacterized protein n=1 Tax=Lophiostoma macrostomum CBS 122681 TaxID=1314788 RepID=A0A6A6SIZ5_9PLEO|nr:hypothetical protein K491DRAFT_313444 [Lophiostoma macrostomum CBS 122681]